MSQLILWNTEGVELPMLDYPMLARWIGEVIAMHNRVQGALVYVFCDDAYILKTNVEFLNHDYYTDIITFDYCRGKVVSGDMVISLDTVRTNAELVGATYDRELLRVIIHGVLHLCGINDKGPGEREIMEAWEDKALALYDELSC